MELRKTFLFLGLLLAPLSGGSIYYIYHEQTKAITVLQVKSDLGHPIEPGVQITNDLVEPKIILQRDVSIDPILPSDLNQKMYAGKYLYPSDPLTASKITTQPIPFKEENQRIVAIKPSDLGLMGLIQLNDLITITTPGFILPNIRVVGSAEANGNIVTIIPQVAHMEKSGGLLNMANTTNPANARAQEQGKGADHLLVLVTKENADMLSKLPKETTITITFEKRPSIPDTTKK
jgi:hypothetical protein